MTASPTSSTLRGEGVRTSKVEMIEMLLWELAGDTEDIARVRERLGRFSYERTARGVRRHSGGEGRMRRRPG